jgi:hypothetical protein
VLRKVYIEFTNLFILSMMHDACCVEPSIVIATSQILAVSSVQSDIRPEINIHLLAMYYTENFSVDLAIALLIRL